jgi:hypothetical protein
VSHNAALRAAGVESEISDEDIMIASDCSGPEVVHLCIEKIKSTVPSLPEDNDFMRRVAYVMSDCSRVNSGSGGIWQLSRTAFEDTMDTVAHDGLLPIKLEKIKQALSIDWRKVEYQDLDKPFYSALGARLFLSNDPDYIPPAQQVRRQAEYWNSKYMMGKGDIHTFEQKVLSMA